MAMRRSLLAATAALALIVGVSGALAQDRGEGEGRRGGQGQQMDPEQMRARMMDALKERLGATDEEWQALEPKVQAVLRAQQNARAGAIMGMAMGRGGFRGGEARDGGGGRGFGGPEGEPTPLMTASRELRETLGDEAADAEQIKAKLEAFRAARNQAETELDAARAELQGLLTLRQEATLVAFGMLE